MNKQLIDKSNLNPAEVYRVAAKSFLRGLYTSVTYGDKKGADLYVIGKNTRAAVIEVKASQSRTLVTGLYQKSKSEVDQSPNFWVLYSVKPTESGFAERFFLLNHKELATLQGEVNGPSEKLSHEQIAARVSRGVDNVSLMHVETQENAWSKVSDSCQRNDDSIR
jgi:hypothetical protein